MIPHTHSGFQQAIVDDPDNDLPRLVYADWLDEQGNPRGEFFRVQCECEQLEQNYDTATTHYKRLKARETELLDDHREEWEQELQAAFAGAKYDYMVEGIFRRGMLEGVLLYWDPSKELSEEQLEAEVNGDIIPDFLERLSTYLENAPSKNTGPNRLLMRELSFDKYGKGTLYLNDEALQTMAEFPILKTVKRLTLSNQDNITTEGVNHLTAEQSSLRGLEELKIDGEFLRYIPNSYPNVPFPETRNELLEAMDALRNFPKLRVLDLSGVPINDDMARRLTLDEPKLKKLEELHLNAERIGWGVSRLGDKDSPLQKTLKKLVLHDMQNTVACTDIHHFTKLESLHLTGEPSLSLSSIEDIKKCRHLKELTISKPEQCIRGLYREDGGFFAGLFEPGSRLTKLKSLSIEQHDLRDQSNNLPLQDIRALTSLKCRLKNLEHLTLTGFDLGDPLHREEMCKFMDSPLVHRLHTLNLSDDFLYALPLRVLAESTHPSQLVTLDYGSNVHLNRRDAYKALASSTSLTDLRHLTLPVLPNQRKRYRQVFLEELEGRPDDALPSLDTIEFADAYRQSNGELAQSAPPKPPYVFTPSEKVNVESIRVETPQHEASHVQS